MLPRHISIYFPKNERKKKNSQGIPRNLDTRWHLKRSNLHSDESIIHAPWYCVLSFIKLIRHKNPFILKKKKEKKQKICNIMDNAIVKSHRPRRRRCNKGSRRWSNYSRASPPSWPTPFHIPSRGVRGRSVCMLPLGQGSRTALWERILQKRKEKNSWRNGSISHLCQA